MCSGPDGSGGDGAPAKRVAEEIRHVLSGIFGRGEFRDPDLAAAHITVTEVRIGPDLKRATAFFSRLGRSDADTLVPALVRATPYLRGQVAKALFSIQIHLLLRHFAEFDLFRAVHVSADFLDVFVHLLDAMGPMMPQPTQPLLQHSTAS